MKQFVNKVVVFGGSHHNTLGVIRSLGEKGLEPYLIVVSNEPSFVTRSRYIKKWWLVHDEKDGIDILLKEFNKLKNKSVLICTSDSASSWVDLNLDQLSDRFYLPSAGNILGRITSFMNKTIQANLALKHGLDVPYSYEMNSKETLEDKFTYPVIVKPLRSIDGVKSDIRICKNFQELKEYFILLDDEDIQIQKYIDKEFEFQVIGCSLSQGSNLIVPGISKILRCPSNTNTGFLKILPLNEFCFDFKGICGFIKEIGYSGLFSMEFIRDKNGKDYFMEINLRNDGNAYSVTAAGVNLPYVWYLGNILEDSLINEPLLIKKQIYVMPEISDFHLACKGFVSLKEWWKDFRKTDSFLLYNKKDKRPFYYLLFSKLIYFTLKK